MLQILLMIWTILFVMTYMINFQVKMETEMNARNFIFCSCHQRLQV